MGSYLLRRLLLIIPTMFGIMLINFAVIQIVPGGPVEQMIAQMTGTAIESTARLRLAKILLSLEKPQEALEVVKQAKVLNGAMLEVKGDAESQLNRFNEANISYLQALESTQSSSLKSLIRMKIADLQTDSDDK